MKCTILLLVAVVAACNSTNITIQLSARDVDNGDYWSPTDPYVIVKYAIGNNPWVTIGSTEVLSTKDPDWNNTFQFTYVDHMDQHVQFEIMDDDIVFDDRLGSVTLRMGEIATLRTIERDFGHGRLIVKNIQPN